MSDNALALNQQDFQKRVTEHVQSTFLNLLPEQAFAELVEKEIDAFFNATSENFKLTRLGSSWGSGDYALTQRVSPFRQMVWHEVHKLVDVRLKEHFESEGFSSAVHFDEFGEVHTLNALMEDKLEKMATKLAAAMFSNMFGQAVTAAKHEVVQEVMEQVNANRVY